MKSNAWQHGILYFIYVVGRASRMRERSPSRRIAGNEIMLRDVGLFSCCIARVLILVGTFWPTMLGSARLPVPTNLADQTTGWVGGAFEYFLARLGQTPVRYSIRDTGREGRKARSVFAITYPTGVLESFTPMSRTLVHTVLLQRVPRRLEPDTLMESAPVCGPRCSLIDGQCKSNCC